jgi:LysR family hca operon transcriptional activator
MARQNSDHGDGMPNRAKTNRTPLVAIASASEIHSAMSTDFLGVVSRPLEGEAPTIDLAVGYSKANSSPILKLFLSRVGELRTAALERR